MKLQLPVPNLISRRQAIMAGAALGATAVLGAGMGWLHPAREGYLLLCEDECDIVEAVARVCFPPGWFPIAGGDGGTAPMVDQLLAREVDPASATPFRYLLRSIQVGTLISRGKPFTSLNDAEAREVLDVWASGQVFPRRLMSDSFKAVIGMAFLRRPEVLAAVGYRAGCPPLDRAPRGGAPEDGAGGAG